MERPKLDLLLNQLSEYPEALEFVRTYADEFSESLVEEVFGEVDESPFSLEQWILSFQEIEDWLQSRDKRAKVADQLGYVSCAGWTVATSFAEASLPEVVSEMLAEHGFENTY